MKIKSLLTSFDIWEIELRLIIMPEICLLLTAVNRDVILGDFLKILSKISSF